MFFLLRSLLPFIKQRTCDFMHFMIFVHFFVCTFCITSLSDGIISWCLSSFILKRFKETNTVVDKDIVLAGTRWQILNILK